jgi:lysophospholipase L1-like esterase
VSLNRRLGLLTILLAVGLIASVALNVILYLQANKYYVDLNQTRLDPLGLNYFTSDVNQSNAGQRTVLFFGDSRVAQWPPPGDVTGFRFVNRGIGAHTSTQTLERFNVHVEPLAPHVIILQVGINDLKTIPLFPDRKEAIIAACKENIREIVMRSADMGATVILTTIFPVGEMPFYRQRFWSPEVDQAIDEVNAYIRSLAAPHVIMLDAYTILANSGMKQQMYVDELHLNAKGYEILNRELTQVLAALK